MSTSSPTLTWPVPFETDSEYFARPPLAYLLRKEPGAAPAVLNASILQSLLILPPSNQDRIGVLVGARARDSEDRPFLLVVEALQVKPLSPEFSAYEPKKLTRQIEDICVNRPGLQVVGWYRCRAQGRLELSALETDFHRGCFQREHQICLLLDPSTREAGIHGWESSPTSLASPSECGVADGETAAPAERRMHGPRGFYLFQPGPRIAELVQWVQKERPGAADTPKPEFSPEYSVAGQPSWKYHPEERFRRRPSAPRRQSSSASETTPPEAPLEPRVLGLDALTAANAERSDVPESEVLTPRMPSEAQGEAVVAGGTRGDQDDASDLPAGDPTTIVPGREKPDQETRRNLIDGLEKRILARDWTFALLPPPPDDNELAFVVKVAPGRNRVDLTMAGLEVRLRPADLTARPTIVCRGELRRSADDSWWERHLQVSCDELDRICQYLEIVIKDLS